MSDTAGWRTLRGSASDSASANWSESDCSMGEDSTGESSRLPNKSSLLADSNFHVLACDFGVVGTRELCLDLELGLEND